MTGQRRGAVVVFRNARLFDGLRYRGDVGDVVVENASIRAVGGTAPSGAVVVDVGGGLLAPGFVDAHVHAVQGGLERIRCDLSDVDPDEHHYLRAIARYAAAHPDREWVLGGGWSMAAFPGGNPTTARLDEVLPDRPVFLPNRDHHSAWVNTVALRLAGVTRTTPNPSDGRIERDPNGEPAGTIHEGAMQLVGRQVPATHQTELDAALLAGQAHLHSVGVTSWQDAIVGTYAAMDDNGPAYARAARSGRLSAHVVGALWWDRDRGAEQIADLQDRRTALTHGRFRAMSVKVMQDGVTENGTAALVEPYLDRCGHVTDNAGLSFVDPVDLREHVRTLDRLGFQVHVHGLGDRGVREALDAFEGTDPSRRHHIAHLHLVHPDDVPRFARLGVSANIQALWACLDDQMTDLTIPFLGEERARRQYPFGDLAASGAHLVAGSDWPVTSPDPLRAMHVAVHRTAYGVDGRAGTEPFLPEQALDLTQAMRAYTHGSAWVNHRDDAGVIAPGAVADLVVLDADPFLDPTRIGATSVVSTWVDGEPVWQA